jgi:hypothetical protein
VNRDISAVETPGETSPPFAVDGKKKGPRLHIARWYAHSERIRVQRIDPQPSDGHRLLDLNRGRAFPGARESYLNRISAGVHFFTLIMTKSLVKVVTDSSFFNFSVNTEKAHLWLKSMDTCEKIFTRVVFLFVGN